VIAVDTNVLVYAHREDSPHHAAAVSALRELADSRVSWCVPWPCVHEFLAIVTHPRIFIPPTGTDVALEAMADLFALPGFGAVGEGPNHLGVLSELLDHSGVVGPKIHDARIAAICLGHGVSELWTADRDFSYFPELPTRNPLVGHSGD
jgi:toxin-antitoxin system PIN domain toxin